LGPALTRWPSFLEIALAKNVPVLKQFPEKQKIICDILGNGGTLLEASIKIGLDRSQIFRFRMQDDDFDEAYRAAWIMGIEIQMEESEKRLRAATTRDEIMAADKNIRHDEWKAEKLLPHYQPKQKVEVEHSGPMILGWDTGPQSCPKCGWNMDAVNDDVKVIEHGEGLQEGISEVPFEAGTEETAGGPERRKAKAGEAGYGPQG
tara:strand:+ start:702 stop:1316 length:615 start_codon:yes stop_codon:yes gene_type:complete